jgi:hypothetical protein
MPERNAKGHFVCRVCNVSKSVDQYYKNSNTKSGYDGRCKGCESERRKRSYHENFERETYNRLKNRSRQRGITFDLELEDIPKLPKYCPILGVELVINWGGKAQSDNSPTLDKIIPEKGYVKGNIDWLSSKANNLKADNTIETLEKVLRYLRGRT